MTRRWSMSRRLVWTLTGALGGLWLIAAAASALTAYGEINELFDDALRQTAERLLPLMRDDLDAGVIHLADPDDDDHDDEEADGEVDDDGDDYLLYQVRDGRGRILLRSPDAPAEPFSAPLVPGFADTPGYRLFTAPSADGRLAVQVAQPVGQRWETIADSLIWLVAPLVALLPLAGAAIWWTVARTRRPLAAMQRDIRARGGTDLTAIGDAGLPVELAPIAADVNRLLARLQAALEGERALAANSAHELRTPVAAAHAQGQRLAALLDDGPHAERAGRMVASLASLGRLIEKLLQLARVEAGVALAAGPVDLLPALRLLAGDYRARPEVGDRLTFDDGGRDCLDVQADIDAAGIAIQNLIDNALGHGDAGSPVNVRVAADGAIHVVSAGPAVAADLLPALRHRFARGDTGAPGSGLGLAIVDAIMRQSGGALDLISPATGRADGFEAVLRFAAAPSSALHTPA